MRTTLEIDDDVLTAAEHLASRQGSSAGKVLSDLARTALGPQIEIRNGVPLLPPRPEARQVTPEDVYRLLDEDV